MLIKLQVSLMAPQVAASRGLLLKIPGNLSLTNVVSTVSSSTDGVFRCCPGNMYLSMIYVHVLCMYIHNNIHTTCIHVNRIPGPDVTRCDALHCTREDRDVLGFYARLSDTIHPARFTK